MKKRIISAFLALCMLFVSTATVVLAADAAETRDYYNLSVIHTDYQGYSSNQSVDFMVLTSGESAKVYIKAEDFSKVTGGDYSYEYNQTYTECAYVSASTKHVVRYMLNSSSVSVVYVGDSVAYTAPYPTLYENGVTWLPFEFSVQLFHLQAIPQKNTIQIISSRYNPISVANLAHQQVRQLGFDWIDEVGESIGGYLTQMASATTASCVNKLLSFEPSAWGSMLASAFGYTAFIDAEYAESIAKTFISPSQQEIEIADSQFLKVLTSVPDAYDDIMDLEIYRSSVSKTLNNADEFVKTFVNKIPALGKSKAVVNLQKALAENKNGFKKVANGILAEMGKALDNYGESSIKLIEFFLTFAEMMENYLVFLNKNARATSALALYSTDSKYRDDDSYDEIDAFERYSSENNDFLKAVNELAIDATPKVIDNAIKGGMGLFGVMISTAGLAWDLASGIGPLKTGINAADSRVLSEYAIRYQDDALGVYYNYRNNCITAGGANEESLDDMLSSMYAYMKFSYIARNAATASFTSKADITWGDRKVSAQNCAEALSRNNQKLAEYLIYMEGTVFTPSVAAAFTWNDAPYAEIITAKGSDVDAPTQNTEPIFEFPAFPGFEDDSYISEEEAIELVKEVMGKFTGGAMASEFLGAYLDIDMESLYTYEVIDNYVDGDIKAYVVLESTNGKADALFFVSVIGTEVWLGTPKSEGGYYVYTNLDLLHADTSDLVGAIGDLGGQLMDEMVKDVITTEEASAPAETAAATAAE